MAHQDHHPSSSIGGSSSSSSSSSPSLPSQPSPPKHIINAADYSMLINNDVKKFFDKYQDMCLLNFESNNNNSILHLAASIGQLNFIDSIIQKNTNLLHSPNSMADLPIHVAARACQFKAVEKLVYAQNFCLISSLSYNNNTAVRIAIVDPTLTPTPTPTPTPRQLDSMLEKRNNDGNTALHIALENQQEKMAEFLVNKCPKTIYYLNEQGISPLYLAIKAEFWDLVTFMLSLDIALRDPENSAENLLKKGKSVVHAAIIAKNKDIMEMILNEFGDLIYEKDEMGRKPLAYASYTGFLEGVNYILTKFPTQAFKIDDQNGWFPIHWACSGGYLKIVKEFFTRLPSKEARLVLTNKLHNILHVAAAFGKAEIVKFILQQSELESLINMKDEDGNTPLHLASLGKHPKVVYVLTWDDRVKLSLQNNHGLTALDIAQDYHGEIPSFKERLTWLSLRYAGVPTAPQLHYFNVHIMNDPDMAQHNPLVLNHSNNTSTTTTFMVVDQLGHQVRTLPKKRKNKYKERINTLLVVATLVATVTFASGFSVPGGYNNNKPDEGMATLAHKCAFQIFVISNSIAMFSAILAAVSLIWAHLDDARLVLLSLDFALPLLAIALAMMSVAFTTGLYVVLHRLVFWLGVVVLVMGGVFLGALLILIIPLYSPTSCIRNKIMRYVFRIPFILMLWASGREG